LAVSRTKRKELRRARGKDESVTTGDESAIDPLFFAKVQELQKKADISELIELMDETHKNKTWLIGEIKKKRQKIHVTPDMGTVTILRNCDSDFISRLIGVLKSQRMNDFDIPAALSRNYHWFFTDIVSSSDPTLPASDQARKIYVLNRIIAQSETFQKRSLENTVILPTGDGMAIGFGDSPELPLKLSLEVHEGLYAYNKSINSRRDKINIRIGLETGPVFSVEDLNGNQNVWGPGIIMARRVMDLAREMNILASARFANDIRNLKPEYRHILHPIGDYNIKHGEKILVYNVFGDGFGNKKEPIEDKNEKSMAATEIERTSEHFIFSSVAIQLEVMDNKSKLVHHKVRQNYVNISNKPIGEHFFYLDGDVPRDFPDCNVVVKDEDDKELEIMSINVNKPYHKEFFVKRRKAIGPGEKSRSATLEYDWDEPENHFSYRFATTCKKFTFSLDVPKGIAAKPKVVRVIPEVGLKKLATEPPIIKFKENQTNISWSASDLREGDAFRFDW
jgi:hypothetical protein